jgi:periplasmic protein TonB
MQTPIERERWLSTAVASAAILGLLGIGGLLWSLSKTTSTTPETPEVVNTPPANTPPAPAANDPEPPGKIYGEPPQGPLEVPPAPPRTAPSPEPPEPSRQLYGTPYCSRTIQEARSRFGDGWRRGISPDDAIGCAPQIEQQQRRDATGTSPTPPPSPAPPAERPVPAPEEVRPSTAQVPPAGSTALPANLEPLVRHEPVYPERALRRGIEGYAIVEFIITRSGKTVEIHTVESSPPGVFDRAAENAIRKWRYAKGVGPLAGVRVRCEFRMK